MKRHRLSAVAALAVGVLVMLAGTACGSTVATTTAPVAASNAAATATAAAAGSGIRVVVFDCVHHAQVRPKSFILTCADDGSFLSGLSWSRWTPQQAIATGVHRLNDCTPSCAEGKFRSYPAIVTFWRGEPVAGHPGEKYFTMITVRYTGPRPPAYTSDGILIPHPAAWSQPLGTIG